MLSVETPRRAWIACVLLLAVGIATQFDYVWRSPSLHKLLGSGDSHWYFGPQNAFLDWSIARGELPQWSPLNFCGQPFAANPQTGVFYPPNLLRSLLTFEPTPLRTHLGAAILSGLHILAAGIGAFALARAQTLSTGASLVSAWGFAFSASFVRRVVGNQFLGVVSWLPFVLLALQRGMETREPGRRTRTALVAGLWFGLSVLGGFPQLSIYVGAGLAVYVLAQRLSRGGIPSPRALGADAGVLAIVAGVAALVAAPMLLPAAEFLGQSTRLDPATSLGPDLVQISQFPGAAPLFQALSTYPGSADFGLNYRASGACILILALLGALHAKRRSVAVWAALFFAFLDCSLGPPAPLSSLLAEVLSSPLISPSRGFFLACLPLALLAGFGVDALNAPRTTPRKRAPATLFAMLAGAAVVASLYQGLGSEAFLGRQLEVLVFPIALGLVWIGGLWRRAAWVPPALLLLVALETVTWNRAFVPFLIEGRAFAGETAQLDQPQDIPLANRRSSSDRSNGLLYGLQPSMIGYDPLQLARSRRVICSPKAESEYSREIRQDEATALNQRGHLLLKRPFWLARQFVRSILPPKDQLFAAAHTAFLLTDAGLQLPEVDPAALRRSSVATPSPGTPVANIEDLHWEPGRQGKQRRLVIPRFDVPRQHSALRLRYRSHEDVTLRTIFHGPQDPVPGATLALKATGTETREVEAPLPDLGSVRVRLSVPPEQEPPQILSAQLVSDTTDEDEALEILDWSANAVSLDVGPLDGPRVLTFVDAHFPGWSATVDGEDVPIFLAADAFKAIEVPAGSHRIEFRFASRRLGLGLAISALTLVLCSLHLIRGRRPAQP